MIDTTISGIPCLVRLDYFEPVTTAYRRGHPDNWEPESGGELDYTVLDRRGRPAPWLARKMTPADQRRIETQLLETL